MNVDWGSPFSVTTMPNNFKELNTYPTVWTNPWCMYTGVCLEFVVMFPAPDFDYSDKPSELRNWLVVPI
jgi:hypothetical protein